MEKKISKKELNMVNLFVSLYKENDRQREHEIRTCLERNLTNRLIDRIYVLEEGDHGFKVASGKAALVRMNVQPTFSMIFSIVNNESSQEDINIIANSDIYFDEESISYIKAYLSSEKCFALTRWNIIQGQPVFMNARDSQDTWCFKGHIRPIEANFKMGFAGCDNSLALKIQEAGYTVTNPSWTIKTYHLHESIHRGWYGKETIPPPYLLLEPSTL